MILKRNRSDFDIEYLIENLRYRGVKVIITSNFYKGRINYVHLDRHQ